MNTEPQTPTSTPPRSRRTWITIAAAAPGIGIIAAVTGVAVASSSAGREQTYLDALRADPKAHVTGIPDEQLLVSRKVTCENIDDGLTAAEAIINARNNWSASSSLSDLTEDEYLENVGALDRAAAASC